MKHSFLISMVWTVFLATVAARTVPSMLPHPDGKSGHSKKPLKIYLLAGQSNMVGMGQLSGAKNLYTGMYYTPDPNTPKGPMEIFKVGKFLIAALPVFDPDGNPTADAIAMGKFEVPESGIYRLHASTGTIQLDGNDVASDQDLNLEAGTRYTFTITGGDDEARPWMQKMDLLGYGDLEAVVKREGKFPWLLDKDGEWTVRQDVIFREARLTEGGKHSSLSPTSNGKTLGPELGFGHVMGTFHDEQVLVIKTAQGNRSLGFDFRPPSSGRTDPDNKFESAEYQLMVKGVRETLENLDEIVPGYTDAQGYELAGFAWFQGHKDSFSEDAIANYEKHLVNLIQDLRKEFKVPDLAVVVATVGFGGHNMAEKFRRIHAAQMAVGDAARHPEFKGRVTAVDTRDFWREVSESPRSEDYHYNRNAETYTRIGDAIGRAMVALQGGTAEPLPVPPRAKTAGTTTNAEPSEAERVAGQKALAPILIDGIAAEYIRNPRYSKALTQEASGQPLQRPNQFLRGAMFGLVNCYRAAGIKAYDWQPFGPDLDAVEWQVFSFDPPESLPREKGNRYRKVTLPAGMENWFAPDFDPVKAGWKAGRQPFGQLDGNLAPLSESCTADFCRCGEKPNTLWEKEVLLARGNFDFPPLKDDHRYRIVVGGSAHVNSGEGFAIYVNGKLLAESDRGVAVRQGGQPRGAYITNDFREAFGGGKVTLAVTGFLRYNHPRHGVQPPRGHLSLKVEEQQLPPVDP